MDEMRSVLLTAAASLGQQGVELTTSPSYYGNTQV